MAPGHGADAWRYFADEGFPGPVVPYTVPFRRIAQVVGRCEKPVRKAHESPGSLRFAEACRLARCLGFEQVRQISNLAEALGLAGD